MSAIWKALERKYPTHFNHHTLPVWLTLFPCISGCMVWAGYMGYRNLLSNDIVWVRSKEVEPYRSKESPKLYNRDSNLTTLEKWSRKMDPHHA